MTSVYIEYRNIPIKDESAEYYWRQEFEFIIKAASLSKPRPSEYSIEKLNIAGEFSPGNNIWILSIITAVGDSFGCGKGEGEVLWAFRSQESAEAARKAIETCKDKPSIEFLDDTGVEIKLSNPACFPDHDYIESVTMTMLAIID